MAQTHTQTPDCHIQNNGGRQGDSPAPPTPPSPCKYKTTHKRTQINISYNRDFAKVCFGFPGVSLRRVRLLVPLAQTGNSESFCSSLFPSFRCQSCDVVLKPNQSCRKQATASSCCSFDSHPPSRRSARTWLVFARALQLCKFLDQVFNANVFNVLFKFLVDLQNRFVLTPSCRSIYILLHNTAYSSDGGCHL